MKKNPPREMPSPPKPMVFKEPGVECYFLFISRATLTMRREENKADQSNGPTPRHYVLNASQAFQPRATQLANSTRYASGT
eukprot:m.44071 g.44071  ORF g.44071 m.44071 type:complete len:81 (+) comp11676_c0_seq2:221-463(+)